MSLLLSIGIEKTSQGKSFNNIFPSHAFESYDFVPAGMSFDYAYPAFTDAQNIAQKFNEFFISFVTDRRRCDIDAQNVAGKANYFVFRSAGLDFNRNPGLIFWCCHILSVQPHPCIPLSILVLIAMSF